MTTTAIPAHYDGQHIILDKDVAIPENAKLFVTILDPEFEAARRDWEKLSLQRLEQSYGDNEPDYSQTPIKLNPLYEE
jgi:hypothetical protein